MGSPIKIHPGEGIQLKQEGVFNLQKLYSEMKEYITSLKYSFNVTNHAHKQVDKGEEILLTWEAEREVTDFLKFKLKIDFTFQDLNKAGKDLYSGKARIIIQGFLIPDYREKWSTSRFKQFLYDTYLNIFYKDRFGEYAGRLTEEMNQLQNIAKEVLDFYR